MRTFLLIAILAVSLGLVPAGQTQAAPTGAQPAVATWHSLVDGLASLWNGLLGVVPWSGFGGEGADNGPTGDLGPLVEPDGISAPVDLGPASEPDGVSRAHGKR